MKKDSKTERKSRLVELAPRLLAVVTGGFLDSGPSDANRVIERHELPGNEGSTLSTPSTP
jgi:hypothetical protein